MPIETNCTGCGQLLRVADQDAGKQARCPKCQTVFTVPSPAPSGLPAVGEAGQTPWSSAEVMWHLRIEDGRSYGPIPKSELDSWMSEGRLTANCEVRRDGDSQWQSATTLYPSLARIGAAYGGKIAEGQNPFSDDYNPNPYTASNVNIGQGSPFGGTGYRRAHRGGTVLALGIISVIPCLNICFIPGICAWTMGNSDLGAMRLGLMDRAGEGTTKAGMILGIIGTIIQALIVAFQLCPGLANIH